MLNRLRNIIGYDGKVNFICVDTTQSKEINYYFFIIKFVSKTKMFHFSDYFPIIKKEFIERQIMFSENKNENYGIIWIEKSLKLDRKEKLNKLQNANW